MRSILGQLNIDCVDNLLINFNANICRGLEINKIAGNIAVLIVK